MHLDQQASSSDLENKTKDKSHFLTQKHHNPQASSSSDLEN